METAHIPALFSKQGWLTNVQYTVPCGLCGWKYITSVQYTVQYSTVHSTVHVAGNTLQVYSTVPCGCLEKKQPGLRIIFRFLVQKRSSRTWKNFYKYKFHTHTHQTFGYRKEAAIQQILSKPLTTCLADKTNHPVERLSLNRSQCGSCSTKYDTLAGT